MDKLTNRITIGAIIVIVVLCFIAIRQEQLAKNPLGSVSVGGEYKYTLFTGSGIASTTLLKDVSGAFGSVVITEDQAGAVTFYDATSTEAVTDGSSALYDTVAIFESGQTEGVYTFDVSFYKGLVIDLDGETFAGNWTVTWR